MKKEALYELIPEFALIEDVSLREKTAEAMLSAIEQGGWADSDVTKCPVDLKKYPSSPLGNVEYTRMLTGVANEIYASLGEWINEMNPCEKDWVISGALLSGIGRFLEYTLDGDGCACRSNYGKLFRYPWPGAYIAMECGLPEKVVHIVVTISSEVSPGRGKVITTAESVLVRNAEVICAGILRHFCS